MNYVVIKLGKSKWKMQRFVGRNSLAQAIKFAADYRKRHPLAKVEVK